MRREVEEAVPFIAEEIFFVGRFVGGGVVEKRGVSVEGMEFAFDAFLRDEGAEVGRRSLGYRGIGENIGKSNAAVAEAGENSIEVIFLFEGEFVSVDRIEWKCVWHAPGFSRRRVGSVFRISVFGRIPRIDRACGPPVRRLCGERRRRLWPCVWSRRRRR